MFMLLFKSDIQNVYAAILHITMKAYNEQELSSSKKYKINIKVVNMIHALYSNSLEIIQ